jgi:glycerophosphoryl diester phosphodiesterase
VEFPAIAVHPIPSDRTMARKPVFPIAHRGASAYAPENTVAAFEEAIRLGAPAVEFDLRITADGVPVVLHDETVDRTTSGTGKVAELSWTRLLQLDAGSWMHHRFAATRIPSLQEALLAIGPFARPIIELKAALPWEIVLSALRKFDMENDVLVISFKPEYLSAIRKISKDVPIGLLSSRWEPDLPQRARSLDAEALLLHTDVLGTSQVAAAEALGLDVWCFTPNDAGTVAASAAMGVTGIITDRPDLIRTR